MPVPTAVKTELSAIADKAWDAIIDGKMKVGETYVKRFSTPQGEYKVRAMWDGKKLHLEIQKRS